MNYLDHEGRRGWTKARELLGGGNVCRRFPAGHPTITSVLEELCCSSCEQIDHSDATP